VNAPANLTPGNTERVISRVLRTGVGASLLFVAVGSLLSFRGDGGYGSRASDVARLIGQGGTFPRSAEWLWNGLLRLDGQALIVTGLVLLIATPVLRVAVSLASFIRERDRPFALITATVLALLALSIALGRFG
jgi:uncharacterized membrane protein